MKKFSKAWKSSSKVSKQRKFRLNAPLHLRGRQLSSPLAKALKEKYGKNAMRVRRGDTVKVLRGEFKGKEGKVERVDADGGKIFVEKMERVRKDGSKSLRPIDPSKVMIMEMFTDDKKRIKQGVSA
jgi:large subunit ribosomal protein L24